MSVGFGAAVVIRLRLFSLGLLYDDSNVMMKMKQEMTTRRITRIVGLGLSVPKVWVSQSQGFRAPGAGGVDIDRCCGDSKVLGQG